MLKDIDLTEQKDTLSMNLSGGQKRKLCVGVALVGNPKVLMICLRHKSKSVECLHGHIIRCKKNYFYRFGAEYVRTVFLKFKTPLGSFGGSACCF